MPWSAVAAEAPPENVAPLSGDPLLTLERELVRAESVFHATHVLLAQGRLSQLGRCLGKLPAERREPVAMAASHLSSTGRDAHIDFLCASSSLFT